MKSLRLCEGCKDAKQAIAFANNAQAKAKDVPMVGSVLYRAAKR
jgi:hypothetical protein